jgi:glycosyltransferase involved in cell wall biosynthesis
MIALVWNAPCRLVEMTVRYEVFVEGLRTVGVEALTICPAGMEAGYPYPVRTFQSEQELLAPEFWTTLDCTGALIINWHRMTGILRAMRAAGMRVLAVGESDGQMSPRHHPWATLRFMTALQPTLRNRLGAAKHWGQRFLFRAATEHQALAANVAAADVFTLAGQGAVAEFRRLLDRIGAAHLAGRVVWLPYPIPDCFCTGPVAAERPNRIIAVGRWDSPQKNGPLLAAAVHRLAASGAETEVVIVGKNGEEQFGRLAKEVPTVRILGVQPRDRVRELMAECRAVVISSRWESGPNVAWEMLALGGTVIGTPIPNLRAMTADGRFGRVCERHTPAALADAIRLEISAWDRRQREPAAIAAHWRPLVRPAGVARRVLDLLRLRERVLAEVR